MKKVKSLVKKLIGRPANPPFTIDIVQRTASGYCIIGWYFTDDVKGFTLTDSTGSKATTSLININRDDVLQATGKKAVGFELHVSTAEHIANFTLTFETTKGTVKATLPSSDDGFSSTLTQGKIESATQGKSNVKASCEFAIETPTHYMVAGWVLDDKKATDFQLQDSKSATLAEYKDGLRIQRTDVIDAFGDNSVSRKAGFYYLFEKAAAHESSDTLFLAFTYKDTNVTVPIDNIYPATQDPSTNAKRLLNHWHPTAVTHLKKAPMFACALKSMFPADALASVARHNFNKAPSQPDVSLIIPLYGRYDFMRYQLSHFGRTKTTANCEIIYVVDDPKIAAPVMKLAREMQLISTQPFTVLQLSNNVGFGKANNIGVKYAKADIIALVNSDILPKSPDWLEKLSNTAKQPDAGIVGARLLFEDETLQHDGMAPMTLAEYPGLLFNDHPKKGWPKELAPYTDALEPCPLITAACWVMKKSLYDELNGFAPEYVLGDFEDSDMCLRMLALGKTNYLHHDVELYHLERQSQNLVEPGKWKHNITILNAVHFNNKWKSTLEKMEEANA